MKLALQFETVRIEVDLLETPTARALARALPFTSRAQTWGEEVYFATPVKAKLENDARQVVEPGTVCFWTEGDAVALPFGRTPISTDERPKLASPCNLIGRVVGDPMRLAKVKSGESVSINEA